MTNIDIWEIYSAEYTTLNSVLKTVCSAQQIQCEIFMEIEQNQKPVITEIKPSSRGVLMANWHRRFLFNDYPIDASVVICMCSLDLVNDNAWFDPYWRGLI